MLALYHVVLMLVAIIVGTVALGYGLYFVQKYGRYSLRASGCFLIVMFAYGSVFAAW